jgi:hypothetical protein
MAGGKEVLGDRVFPARQTVPRRLAEHTVTRLLRPVRHHTEFGAQAGVNFVVKTALEWSAGRNSCLQLFDFFCKALKQLLFVVVLILKFSPPSYCDRTMPRCRAMRAKSPGCPVIVPRGRNVLPVVFWCLGPIGKTDIKSAIPQQESR